MYQKHTDMEDHLIKLAGENAAAFECWFTIQMSTLWMTHWSFNLFGTALHLIVLVSNASDPACLMLNNNRDTKLEWSHCWCYKSNLLFYCSYIKWSMYYIGKRLEHFNLWGSVQRFSFPFHTTFSVDVSMVPQLFILTCLPTTPTLITTFCAV